MKCVECKSDNPDTDKFCGQCGAEIGRSLEATAARIIRERTAVEIEITERIAERLFRWAKWFAGAAGVVLVLFAFFVGKGTWDMTTVVQSGKDQIATSVRDTKLEIGDAQRSAADLKKGIEDIKAQTEGYKKVNESIAQLQHDMTKVQGEVIDFGKHIIKMGGFEATGTEPPQISFGGGGCPSSVAAGHAITLCAKGVPLTFFQITGSSGPRPVASLSQIGFQDTSTEPKPNCTQAERGTIYVEKGVGRSADKPFLCAKKSDGGYAWIQIVVAP